MSRIIHLIKSDLMILSLLALTTNSMLLILIVHLNYCLKSLSFVMIPNCFLYIHFRTSDCGA